MAWFVKILQSNEILVKNRKKNKKRGIHGNGYLLW